MSASPQHRSGPRILGQAGCPHCGGSGFIAVNDDFVRTCGCAQVEREGLIARSSLPRPCTVAAWTPKLDELKRTLEEIIREPGCPVGHDGKMERDFLSALGDAWGEDRAVPREQIQEMTGLSEREVKALAEHLVAVHRLSDQGLVLGRYRQFRKTVNGCEVVLRGYFWCLTPEEAMRSCQAYWRQIVTSLRTLDAWVGRLGARPKLKLAIQELEGQYRLAFGEKP